MKGKAVIPLVLGLLIGLVAVKYVIDTVRKAQASGQARSTVHVVRAKQDIGAYLEINEDMVEVVETADGQLAPSSDRIEKVEDAIKRVTAKSIPAKAPVLLSMLAPKGARPGMVARIPTGFRAVSVKIDEVTGVAYQLKPGDWVDVNVVMDVNSGSRKKETISEVILQRIQVAAIGQGVQTEPSGNKVKPAKSATLLVKEEEVPKLHLAATRGKITLSLRGEQDSELSEKQAKASNRDLFGEEQAAPIEPFRSAAAEEPKAPGQTHDVIVFRGSPGRGASLERMTFEGPDSFNLLGVSKDASRVEPENPLERAIRRPPTDATGVPASPVPPAPEFDEAGETLQEPSETGDTTEDQDYAVPRE